MNLLQLYGSISTSDTPSSFNSIKQESSSKAGNTPLANTGSSELMGTAVFKGDKLVGELTAIESLCHLLITNELENCNISIPNPSNSENLIDLYVYNKSKPKIDVKIINGSPFISLNMDIEAKILSTDDTSDYINNDNLNELSNVASEYLKKIISEYLYKTSKEFGTDIDSFGKKALSLFLTTKEFKEYNWLDNYKNSFFDVNVEAHVQSAFLLSGS